MSSSASENGIVNIPSPHTMDEVLEKLKNILAANGVTLFAIIDHSGEAAKVGMEMHPTKVVIFGSPKGGTPPMLAAPSTAIDLPLKALVAEDEAGKVWITWNDAEYLRARHGFPQELVSNVAGVAALLQKAAE